MYSFLLPAIPESQEAQEAYLDYPPGHASYRLHLLFRQGLLSDLSVLRFRVEPWHRHLDLLDTSLPGVWLSSARFQEVLARDAVPGWRQSVEVLIRRTGMPLEGYTLFRPESFPEAIDPDRSTSLPHPQSRRQRLTKLVVSQAVTGHMPMLFRASPSPHVLVHDQLRAQMEALELQGVAFAPLETAANPWVGVEVGALRQQLTSQPRNGDAWMALAQHWLVVSQPQMAVDVLEEALMMVPEAAALWQLQGTALAAAGRSEEARAAEARAATLQGTL